MIDRYGLHRCELWPGAVEGAPWWPGMPVCMVGAVAVAGGHTESNRQAAMLMPVRIAEVLDAEVGRGECVTSFSDGPRWLTLVPGGRWWRRRRAVRVLRRAAARCRRG